MAGVASMLPKFHKGALALCLLTVALTALVGDQPLGDALRVQPRALLGSGAVWQPLTANFVFPADSVGLVLGTVFAQWFIGSQLEAFWGTRRYVLLVLGCATAGYLVYALLSGVLPGVAHGGSSGMDLAAIAAFGVVYGKRELSLLGAATLRARTLAIILIAMGLVGPLARGAPWPVAVPWLVAIAGALLITLAPWRPSSGDRAKPRARPKARAKASHLKVVPDDKLLN